MTGIAPGWYQDPVDPQVQRYWDGEGWVGAPLPADATPPDGPPAEPVPPSPAGHTPPDGPSAAPGAEPPAAAGPTPPSPAGPAPPRGSAAGPAPPVGPTPAARPPAAPGAAGPPAGAEPHPGGPYPYAVPLPLPPARPHGRPLATYGARFVARIIDVIAVFLLNAVVNGWFVWQYAREIAPVVRAALADPMGDPPQATARAEYLLITILIIATALWMAYEVPALGNTGQTFGKRVMSIKVVPLEGDTQLGFGRAFRRWFRIGMWTPFWSCCGIGLLFQLIDSVSLLFDRQLRQALHDKGAGTVVIQLPPGPSTPADRNSPTDRTE